jgi:hypothetical protein
MLAHRRAAITSAATFEVISSKDVATLWIGRGITDGAGVMALMILGGIRANVSTTACGRTSDVGLIIPIECAETRRQDTSRFRPSLRMSRNPRRAYDSEGLEIAPMTLANMRENG